jgi:arabinofuranosyltransferase
MRFDLKKLATDFLPLLPALALFAGLAYYFSFTQDDAYISYRYVANYLNGNGLVYNIGERVEGFTNFGWVIYLILIGSVGLGYIAVSKITGFLCGAGVVIVSYYIARELFGEKERLLSYGSAYLVATNLALAYWSPAGLETAPFALSVSLCVWWYLRRSPLLIVGLLWAVWIRPDGAVIAALLIVAEAITERRLPQYSLRCVLTALVLSLPYVAFKISYYHSILPNPFYAKTGLNAVTLQNGAEYVWSCIRDYALGGLGLAICLAFWRRLSPKERSILLVTLGYLLYILLVGGDVLKVHRFFLPVAMISAAILMVGVRVLIASASRQTRQFVTVIAVLGIVALSLFVPFKETQGFNSAEKVFGMRMKMLATVLLKSDTTNFSVAIPTIGVFGYILLGHDIIDMVGLTDSTIARYADEPIPGMQTTWKERKHNSQYLLTRAPSYIVFSTGVKPSAPAEKALMMYRSFEDSYRSVGWNFTDPVAAPRGITLVAFKKVRPVVGPFRPEYSLEYVELMKKGTEAYSAKKYPQAVEYLESAIKAAGDLKPCPEMLYTLGYCYGGLTGDPRGLACWNRAVAQDSMAFGAHRDLYLYEMAMGDRNRGMIHRAALQKLAPWYMPFLDSTLVGAFKRAGQAVPDLQ